MLVGETVDAFRAHTRLTVGTSKIPELSNRIIYRLSARKVAANAEV